MKKLTRREALHQVAAVTAGAVLIRRIAPAQSAAVSGDAKFFPSFKPFTFQTSGAMINGVVGGSGPPLLLMHGAPQTHISWRLVAPKLAVTHTVVATDLRGYGDSSKAPDGENHSSYSNARWRSIRLK